MEIKDIVHNTKTVLKLKVVTQILDYPLNRASLPPTNIYKTTEIFTDASLSLFSTAITMFHVIFC